MCVCMERFFFFFPYHYSLNNVAQQLFVSYYKLQANWRCFKTQERICISDMQILCHLIGEDLSASTDLRYLEEGTSEINPSCLPTTL